jgi:hypothetical protein
LPGLSSSEVSGFIDGKRSILEIYNLVRAEYGNVTTSSNDFKFAWVAGPDYPDVDMEAVATSIQNMERMGSVEIKKLEPTAKGKKK